MTRSEKAKALAAAKPGKDGHTAVRFQHPRLRAEARAGRGHDRMTPAEYTRERLGRGSVSAEQARDRLRTALADPAVRVIAFRWDSPGGSVETIAEFADEIFAARGAKPIVKAAFNVAEPEAEAAK